MFLRQPSVRISSLAAGLMLAALTAAPERAPAAEDWRAAGWTGGLTFSAKTGKFDGCFVTKPGEGRSAIVLNWNRKGLTVTLFNADWSLNAGSKGKVELAVDGRWKSAADSVAIARNGHRAALRDGEAALNALRRGNKVTVGAEGESRTFSLKGSTRAIARMLECYKTYTGA